MKDYLTLGPTPAGENCEQLINGDYRNREKAKAECREFKAQLEREFPNPPANAWFGIKSFPHDFGTYMEVVVYFDDSDEESCQFAFDVECDCGNEWDEVAVQNLRSQGFI